MKNYKIKLLMFLSFISLPTFSYADSTDIASMFSNASSSISAFQILINGVAFLLGLIFAGGTLFKLKEIMSNPNSGQGLKAPIFMFIASVFLIQFAFGIQTGAETLGATGTMFSLTSETHTSSGVDAFEKALNAGLLCVHLIGFVATLTAWIDLYKAGTDKEPMRWGRFFTLIIFGLLCIYIEWTLSVIITTFGINTTLLNFS